MSGTLFIVCIPSGDKEDKLKDNDAKNNRSRKLFAGKNSSELHHKVKLSTHFILKKKCF